MPPGRGGSQGALSRRPVALGSGGGGRCVDQKTGEDHTHRMRYRLAAGTCLTAAALLAVAGCSAGAPAAPKNAARPSSATPSPTRPPGPLVLTAATASWRLPTPLERAVALADGSRLEVLGGLTDTGVSTRQVLVGDPAKGPLTASAELPRGVHDAAGAVLAGQPTVFGGGAASSVDTVQRPGDSAPLATLPTVRSDLAAATIGRTTYLLGGYDGTAPRTDVLATTDGRTFRTVAQLPVGVRYPAVAALGGTVYVVGGELASGTSSTTIMAVDTATGQARSIGKLPQPLSHAAALVLGGQLFVVGGTDGTQRTDQIWRLDPRTGTVAPAGLLPYAVSDAAAAVVGGHGWLVGGNGNGNTTLGSVVELTAQPAAPTPTYSGTGHLAPGSDPSVLPGPVLIADRSNNRLIEVSPAGQVIWQFPRPGDLAPGQTFKVPDDAFFTPDGKQIIATEEDVFAVTLIDVATHQIVWRYGQPGVHGSGPNRLWNPDDAMVLPTGQVVIPDIMNCRLLVVAKGAHTVTRSYGRVGSCYHNPPNRFGSPNGAFPLADGNWLITEINGDWVTELAPGGQVLWSTHAPGVAYPSDTNEVGPNRYLTADYSSPGQVVMFDRTGKTLWRYRPTGAKALDHPSLAMPLPNGDVILNDDRNHRVIVVDPRTDQVVWQYGVTGQPGTAPGLLNNPDGLDLAPPNSLLVSHARTLRAP